MERSPIAKIISVLLKVLFLCGIICLFFLPQIYDATVIAEEGVFKSHTIYYQGAFYLCYILCFGVVFELIEMFHYIYQENPFKKIVEVILKRIAVLLMILSIIVAIKIIFIPNILSIAILFITFIASLCFYVLSQIFKVAIHYKNEVDYMV